MATITKRNGSYRIRVSCGYDTSGKHIERTMTWHPPKGMTERQIAKELNRQAVIFEDAVNSGYITSTVKFSDFTEQWKSEYAVNHFKRTTMDTMTRALKRIDCEIGHLRLDKITTRTIKNLIQSLLKGTPGHKPLGAKSVKNYISFASSIFEYALHLEMISKNPCKNAKIPVVKQNKRDMYTLGEAQLFIDRLIAKAPILYQCYFILAIFGGFRRGELCGLTWDNIDFENNIITIEKALYHITRQGDVLDTPKSRNSNRSLKLSEEVFIFLKKLQDYYESESVRLGSQWTETDFVFKRWDGNAIAPTAPNEWLHRFCDNEGLKYVVPHSFRHLNASLLIDSGASVKTVQACLGHSDASTTLNIYAHAFAKSQAIASEAVASNFKLGNNIQNLK